LPGIARHCPALPGRDRGLRGCAASRASVPGAVPGESRVRVRRVLRLCPVSLAFRYISGRCRAA
jgi:hypothetical protein